MVGMDIIPPGIGDVIIAVDIIIPGVLLIPTQLALQPFICSM
jgi:hypothetical protein